MNFSGKAVASIANYYNIEPETILIAHDDLSFPPGIVRLQNGGGHGGHNGLRDIIISLKTQKFHRLRIGIGYPDNRRQVSDYVLDKPKKNELTLIQMAIKETIFELPNILQGNWQLAMNQLHTLPVL